MLKIARGATLISLLFPLFLGGCLAVDRTPRNLLPTNSHAHVQRSLQSIYFMKATPPGTYNTGEGVDIWHFIKHLEPSQITRLTVRPSSSSGMELSLEFKEYWEKKNRATLHINPVKHLEENSVSSIQIEVQRSMLSLSSCLDSAGRYILGCAVSSNRALSLVNYSELHVGRKLGAGIAIMEEKSLQKIMDNNSAVLIGDRE